MAEELSLIGKCNKVLPEIELKKMQEANVEEETPVDSSLYNKALLMRAFDKQANIEDIR